MWSSSPSESVRQIGFLYLTDVKRLEDLMRRLGFSAGAPPPDHIMEDVGSQRPE